MVKTPEEKAAEKAAKEQAAAEAKAAKEAEKAAEKAAKASGPIVVKHRDHNGETVERTFSQEVHGDNFAKLAAEFIATNAARIVTE
jgi:hypothetical protein